MQESQLHARSSRHPLLDLLVLLLMAAAGFVIVGPVIGYFAALPFYEGSGIELVEALENISAHPEAKIPFFIIQGFATLTGLIAAPAIFMTMRDSSIVTFFRGQSVEWIPAIITLFLVVVFMGVNSVFIEWNANFTFPPGAPEYLKKFEAWARDMEDRAALITETVTQFGTIGELFIAMIVIAVLPALGEEIVFRGLIQNQLRRATGNIHLAIWIAAVLFSSIHFQFFGFLPRLFLGALFGYLYHWSGNLSLAILAHFVNNGISLIAVYFYRQGAFEYDIESPEAAPLPVVLIATLMTSGLLYYFYKYFADRKPVQPSL